MISHNREFFYKYLTAETALKILENRTLRYSSPVLFNDPFDTQTRVGYGFEMVDFMEAFTDELYRLAHDEQEPIGNDNNALFRDIKAWWHKTIKSSDKMPRDVFKQKIRELVEAAVNWSTQYFQDTNSWWRSFVKASRVFCVAEDPDNLLMWAHYSKDHTGLVIQFKCLLELDTPLCVARQVNYVENPPIIAVLDKYIKYITGQATLDNDLLFFNMILSKSIHWKYENEWRVFIPPVDMENPIVPLDSNGEEILDSLIRFYPQEIHSVYFGCRMNVKSTQKIDKCLIGDFSHVKKYKCIRNDKEYKLDFEEFTI